MKRIDLDEVKKIQLDILKNFDDFCNKNNLRYYLAGGTLLGAIRHKGYIPWDDDIDLIMPRPDFMKLTKMFNQANNQYRLNSYFNNKHNNSTVGVIEDIRTLKVYNLLDINNEFGVNIEIFITDGAPNNYFLRKIYWSICNFLTIILSLSEQKFTVSKHYVDKNVKFATAKKYIRSAVKFLTIPIAKCICVLDITFIVTKLVMLFDADKSEYIGCSTFPHYGYRECVKAKDFLPIEKRKFEGYLFNTPKNYQEYLSNLYGDYMKMPPKEKQVSHHDFTAYWKDEY